VIVQIVDVRRLLRGESNCLQPPQSTFQRETRSYRFSPASRSVCLEHLDWGCIEVNEDPRSEWLFEVNGDLALLTDGCVEPGGPADEGSGGDDRDRSA
jgi:hypothetical protein